MEKRASRNHELPGEQKPGKTHLFLAEESKSAQAPMLEMSKQIEEVLFEWNATRTDYPREQCLAELFEQQAEATPETIALVAEEQQLTYAELNRHANRLAHTLQAMGVGPESIVGMCLPRSIEMVIGVLAILKAGGAYLPLDPSSPTERLAFMLTDAQAQLLLTHSSLRPHFVDFPLQVISLDGRFANAALFTSQDNPSHRVGPEHLAYVIYTSGSTGAPKGVCVSQRNVVRLVLHTNYARLSADEVFLQLAPLSFDASTFELWAPLLNGARLVLAPPMTLSLYELAEQLARFHITTLWLTAGLFHQMVEQHLPSLMQLEQLLAGGEALSLNHMRQMLAQPQGPILINGYGPTEGTTFSCCHPLQVGHDQLEGSSVPIGRPIANTQVYVLDAQGNPVPPKVLGELYIGGDGLSRGYLHRPELTAERFVPHPFVGTSRDQLGSHDQSGSYSASSSPAPGARLYRTGDLVRYSPDGLIEFVGRADRQIKLRGFRIELGEIEAVLSQHPSVQQALILLREDRPADKRLVAYVIAAPGQQCDQDELRHHLKQRLPDYMLPAAFVWLDAFPLTRNGKIDQLALPAPEQVSDKATRLVLPRTPLEELLISIWAKVLGISHLGIQQNFFELGGHSLLATQVISQLRSTLGIELPLRTLFDAPTIELLAQQIEAVRRTPSQHIVPPLQAAKRAPDAALPLSAAQQRLWFLDQLAPGSPFYNIAEVWHLQGSLQVPALASSLNLLLARHESLRTIFQLKNDRPVQVILPTLQCHLPVIDLSHLPTDQRERQSLLLRQQRARHPFELSQPPLLVACLLRLDQEEHLLLLTLHHIITDGWSMTILLRELAHAYEAALAGTQPSLPTLPLQYADYALWQTHWLSEVVLAHHLASWRQLLEGFPPLLALPTDRPRPAVQSYQGKTHTFMLSPELTQALIELGYREGATLFMTLLAAFGVVLARLSGQERLLIGTPIANRTQQLVEEIVGFFVNTLPFPLDLSGRPSFRQLLARVRRVALEAYAHQDVPFERLVEEFQPERSLSYAPLCQVFFALQNQPVAALHLPGVNLEPSFQESGTAKFDLLLELINEQGGLLGRLEYSQDLFEPETIQRLAERFQRLLAEVLAHPEQDITQISLLTETEQFFLLEKWNDTRTSYSRESNLAELFEQQVQHHPEAIALVSQEQHLTYAELNRWANRLAHSLQAMGVGPEIIVGLCLERFFEMMIGLLAILKAGGAYLPLDPSSPTDRLTFMLTDAQAKLLLAQSSLSTRFTSLPAEVICLDQWFGEAALPAHEDIPVSRCSAEHLAYVIYTSGSTGIPKGVAVTHRGVLRLVCNTNYIALGPMHRIAQASNASFDALTFEVWGALLHGGQVIEITKEVALSPRVLAQTLHQERITALFLTTALFNQVAREEATAFSSLSYLLFGGEAVDPQWVQMVLQQGKPEHLLHVYGPTESTTFATWYEVNEVGERATTVPIGSALANTQTFVLDKAWNLTPVGVVGELYIAGDGLARGYLHRPDLTAEQFVPHPWGAQPGARLYKTGDLVRYSPDGLIEFVGRADRQIKLRGFRIELGEIEAVLNQHPSVQQALVLLREDRPADKRLVAYVTTAPGQHGVEDELRHHLKQRLPDYMLPSAFIWLDAFPLNPNGKIDQHALPTPQQTNDSAETLMLPRTPLEELLVTIWAKVLGSQVGIQQNFFELGGHSLLATQVISRVRSSLGIELPVRALFDTPTIEQLAQQIETLLWNRQHSASLPLQATERDPHAALPLSAAQQRLWFLDQLAPGSPFYNIAEVWHLQGSLQVPALASSLNLLLARHESLRTIFQLKNDRPVQVILPTLQCHLPVIDLSHLPTDQRERQSLLLRQQRARYPFELSQPPLLVACLLRLHKEEHLLLLTLHHIITDGWSMTILLRELAHAYEAALGDTQPSWPPLPLQYADYALWQTHWLGEEALAHHLASWCQLLEGFPPLLDLPTDRPRPAVQSYWGASHAFILAPELTQKLVELSQNESVTLFMTLLATFGVVLARLSGQERLLIGSPIANRTQQQVEEIVGFFVNTLPFPLDLSGRPSFRQLLARVRQVALEAYAHQDVPFERLVEKFQPERSLSYAPLCQVFFALQNQLMEPQYLPGLPRSIGELRLEPSFQESGTAKFDLTLELTTSQQGLIGRLEYSQDLFEPETIQRLAECFQLVLTQIVAQPEQDVAHIQLLTEDERLLVLEQWNATDNNYEQEQCVHKMIEQQAQRAPEAIALVSQEHHLTYGALNARANQLAHYLRRLGVGPEILVGVCLQRSVEMIIGMLAILKAGGAYLPLDPDYPIERIEYMVRDAQVPLLLTTGSFSQSIEQHYSQPIHLVCLEREYEQKQLFRQSSSNLASVDYLENLAYVIYTSGSTGRPKGVQITHRGLCNLINWHQHNFVVTVLDRATQIASISFDAAVWETWPYLAAGATLYIVEDEMRTMPTTLSDCLAAQQITMCFLPTPLAEMLLDAHEPATSLSNTLRTLLVGGDVLHRPPDKELPFILVNNYGPTENTVVATSGVVLPIRERTGMPTIGYPIANTRLYVLDSLMQPVPIGATGELFIGGSSLARGYLRQPEMTAERFIPDPFGNQPGSRLYKTGDLVRYRANGSLDFIGRNDEQVKIRGFRVEPGEIEAILRQHESIREAAVIVLEDMPGEKRLIAYIVPEREGNLPPNQPGQYLRDRLPHYMIPARIVTLEQLPLSPNGKLDRRALPALNIDLSDLEKSYMPAHTPVEETLVSIWEKVLDVQRIGIYDNFFELGGHSLLATQVISHMRKAFQVDLPLQAIFDTPTIADLAQIIARMQEESPGAPSLQATSNVQAIPEGKEDAESLLARLDQLSTEEIDALLNAKFFERKGER